MYFFTIMLLTVATQDISASTCHSELHLKTPQYRGSFYNYRREQVVTNTSLTCYNVSSFTNLPLPPSYTRGLRPYAQHMTIVDSTVTDLSKGALANFSFIHKLVLSGIHLKTIHQGAFENLTNLRELNLDNNELTEVTSAFSSLRHLRVLSLRNNRIKHIDKTAFQGLIFFVKLYLSDNLLTHFDEDISKTLRTISSVDLSRNPLVQVPKIEETDLILVNISLKKLNKIDWIVHNLNLSTNQLDTFDCSLITRIWSIDLSNNQIVSAKNLDACFIDRLSLSNNRIKKLDGPFNVTTYLDLSSNKIESLENSLFNKSLTLTTLLLSHNKISAIGDKVFKGLHDLRILRLDHNKIKTLPLKLFNDLGYLHELDLSSNEIGGFQYGSFENMVSLKVLNLSNNKLLELDPHIFHAMTNVYQLNFDGNLVSFLDVKHLLSTFSGLQKVSLDHNRWHCRDLVIICRQFSKASVEVAWGDVYDRPNARGIDCLASNSSNSTLKNDLDDYHIYIQEIIDRNVEESEMKRFLAENMTEMEIVQPKESSANSEDSGLVTVSVVQIVMVCLLLVAVSLMFVVFRRISLRQQTVVASRLELVAAE